MPFDYATNPSRNARKASGIDSKVSTPAGKTMLGKSPAPAQGQGVAKPPKGFGGAAGGLGNGPDYGCAPGGYKAAPKGFSGGVLPGKV